MNHKEFREQFYKDRYYLVDGVRVPANGLSFHLENIGQTVEDWYGKYVPNPGCIKCGKPCKMTQLNMGWNLTCGNVDCLSEIRSENGKKCWQDEEFVKQHSNRTVEMWNNPNHRKNFYLSNCKSLGILYSQVYICKMNNSYIKFGVSTNGAHRVRKLLGELVFCSDNLPVAIAAEIEFQIALKYPPVNPTYIGDGYNEIRDLVSLSSMVDFAKSLIKQSTKEII